MVSDTVINALFLLLSKIECTCFDGYKFCCWKQHDVTKNLLWREKNVSTKHVEPKIKRE